jgi:hypothetical protein
VNLVIAVLEYAGIVMALPVLGWIFFLVCAWLDSGNGVPEPGSPENEIR